MNFGVEVMRDFFLVFFIIMIVLLFDWFMGIMNMNFCNILFGMWLDSMMVDMLYFWDVGMDDGIVFDVVDVVINLVEIILIIIVVFDIFFNNFVMGMIVIFGKVMIIRINKFVMIMCSGEGIYKVEI